MPRDSDPYNPISQLVPHSRFKVTVRSTIEESKGLLR